MSAPQKPWERGHGLTSTKPTPVNSRDDVPRPTPNRGTLSSSRSTSALGDTATPRTPPAPPPRSQNTGLTPRYGALGYGGSGMGYGMGYGGYGGYGSSYGGLYSPYGSTGLYGGYGGLSGGYGRFGTGYGAEQSTFARMAEESSRPAFQSIENIVSAFGSVAMMLDSTFCAVYNSFRAVIGVADHFTRMKSHFAQIFASVAFIRPFLWLWRKLRSLLGFSQNVSSEDAWTEVNRAGASLPQDDKQKSSWPILLFFAVIFGGPWLIWRLLSSVKKNEGQEWASGEDDHFEAEAEYSFQGRSEDELSFRAGQRINIAPKELQPRMRGWLLASVDGKSEGFIPVNYIKNPRKRIGRKNARQQQPAQPVSSVVDEERLLNDEFPQNDLEQEQQQFASAFPTQTKDEDKIAADILEDNSSELPSRADSS
ncbi:peroxisomal membrane protein PEX13 [Lingula anatina]|uniref:Peroxisomal membrane protein PEX13 n=1 Tax=Lingula anatina TaxID=7574 RepID=A0A1S3IN51_LINAN|nr:peroxisomal membrane protein PEX13 [Lingula anatina]|eukprot:XP_013399326.1 peroxisomal membrane protein PEX13 [Lingula anatina]